MDFLNIAKTIGSAVVGLHPIGAMALGVVNQFLPENEKLPTTATGNELVSRVGQIPPEFQAQIMSQQFDVTMEQIKQSHLTMQTMLQTEAVSPQSTRPKAVMIITWFVCVISFLYAFSHFLAAVNGEVETIKALNDSFYVVVGILAPFFVVLHAYFGVLRDEKRDTLNTSQGLPAGAQGLLGKLAGKMLGGKQ